MVLKKMLSKFVEVPDISVESVLQIIEPKKTWWEAHTEMVRGWCSRFSKSFPAPREGLKYTSVGEKVPVVAWQHSASSLARWGKNVAVLHQQDMEGGVLVLQLERERSGRNRFAWLMPAFFAAFA